MIELREISKDNINPILKLKVGEEQRKQVATNAESIAEGTYADQAWFRGIYFKDEPVGFVMLSIEPEKNEYWIWRYMIDKKHQGKGYGKEALDKVLDHMRALPGIQEVKLSYVPLENIDASEFYRKFGFVDTGKEEEGELIMSYKIQ